MTKQELQKEILEKVKPGTKPSHLKKLKRSKSEGDIPKAPPLPTSVPISRSKSNEPFSDPQYPYTTLISQQEELDKLKKETETKSTTISLLRKKIEELEKSNPPSQLLQDQLTNKQKELENLREQLELTHQELNTLKEIHSNLLDDNLALKHQSLKDWWQQYEKTKELEQELVDNVDYASNELLNQDKVISSLHTENNQLKLTNQSLTKDLDLTTKLAEMRRSPLPNAENGTYLKYVLYTTAFIFTIWLLTK